MVTLSLARAPGDWPQRSGAGQALLQPCMAWVLHLVREKDGPELLRGPEKQSLGEPPCLRPRAWARHCAPQPPKLQDKQGGYWRSQVTCPDPRAGKGRTE